MEQQQNKKQSDSQFVCKLLDMIQKYPDIVNWNQEGDEMNILDIDKMQSEVLPQYFRHSNFSSFVRQLNMYDFHKLIKQQNSISFKNVIFSKGNDKSYHFIQRKKKVKQNEPNSGQFQKKYNSIIRKLKREHQFPKAIQEAILKLLEYKHSMVENIKIIKQNLDHICGQLKDCRTKKVIELTKQLKQGLLEQITQNIRSSKQIDKYIESAFQQEYQNRQKIPVHVISNSSFLPFFNEESQSRTLKQMVFDSYRFRSGHSWMRIASNNNILGQNDVNLCNSFRSHPFFNQNNFTDKFGSVILAKDQEVHVQHQQDQQSSEHSDLSMNFVKQQNYKQHSQQK